MSTSVEKELTNKGIKPTLYDPRVKERQKLDIPGVQVMQKELGSIHPLIGFSHVIPKNPELLSKINTSKYGPLFIGSPLSFHLKCYYDQILDLQFFTFSHTIGVSKISCQISIYYEQQNSCFLNLSFREFTAAINFPCSKSGLRIGENDVIFSKIPHGLKL